VRGNHGGRGEGGEPVERGPEVNDLGDTKKGSQGGGSGKKLVLKMGFDVAQGNANET